MNDIIDNSVSVTTPSPREICVCRTFKGSAAMLFDAHTKPDLIQQWLLGPEGWTMPVCHVDLRPGGNFRYEWRHQDGKEMGITGEFLEVHRPTRIVHIEAFDKAWHEGSCRVTTTFEEQHRFTLLSMTMLYDTEEIRDQVLKSPAVDGMSEGYDRLDALLTSLHAA